MYALDLSLMFVRVVAKQVELSDKEVAHSEFVSSGKQHEPKFSPLLIH